jgi:hypothetical protein
MQLDEFVAQVQGFEGLQPRAQIRLFGWFLHTFGNATSFDNDAIRGCFRQLHMVTPDVHKLLPRMAKAKPPELLRLSGGYRLARQVRQPLDQRYGIAPSQIAVTRLLTDLPLTVPNHAESVFLTEALNCYRVSAFRACTVMVWNLAFHHILQWILSEPRRITEFNNAIASRFPKKLLTISRRDDFDELKEFEIIEVCRTARLLNKNMCDILREKLTRRNMAAHPSTVVVSQTQADDTITDLVRNIVLPLV